MSSFINELVQCQICFENYDACNRITMMLMCQHSLCKLCLKDLMSITQANTDCPVCRKPIDSNYEEIPKNRFIVQYLETLNPIVSAENGNSLGPSSSSPYPNSKNKPTAPVFPALTSPYPSSKNKPIAPLSPAQASYYSKTYELLNQTNQNNNEYNI